MRIDLVGYLFILPLPHSWCIHVPGIFVCLFIFVFLYIVYSVLHHSETNNHRDTTSWPFQSISCNRQIQIKPQKTETDIRCMCTLKLCYIFHADIFAFALTAVTTAYISLRSSLFKTLMQCNYLLQ